MEFRARRAQVTRRHEVVRTPGPRLPGVRRIAVVRVDRLGDVVLTLPAVDAVRRAYPDSKLALAVRPAVAPLARLVTGVDEVIDADPRDLRAGLARFAPDLVLCISRSWGEAWAAWRSGAPHRVGTGRRWFSPLFGRRVVERRRNGERHELEYALSFAHRVGAVAGPLRFPLVLPDAVEREAAAGLAGLGLSGAFVVLHPGGGGSCPRWPTQRWGELAAALVERGVAVLVTGGPGDEAALAAFGRVTREAGELPRWTGELTGLAARLARAAIVVGNSTGPLHLAAALGRPTLALQAPWPSCGVARWGPYAENGWVIVAEGDGAASWSRRQRVRHQAELMAAIPTRTVLEATLEISGVTSRS